MIPTEKAAQEQHLGDVSAAVAVSHGAADILGGLDGCDRADRLSREVAEVESVSSAPASSNDHYASTTPALVAHVPSVVDAAASIHRAELLGTEVVWSPHPNLTAVVAATIGLRRNDDADERN